MIRVSLDVSAVPSEPVGAGRYTIELAAALARRQDVELALWARRDDAARWTALVGDAAHRVRPAAPRRRPVRLAWEQVRLPGLLAGASVDVHHGPHYTIPERAALPLVATVHDLTFFDHPEWHERTKVALFRRAIRSAARRADAIVCVSARTAELLQRRVGARGRLFVVPHGVDHARFRPDEPDSGVDAQVLGRLGVREPYVLFVGTVEPRKAVPDLVRAFGRVAPDAPELTLVLAGRPGWGSAGEDVERAVAEARVGGRLVRTGYVADDAVPSLLRRAAAVAYPAHEEGFGLPALEALACGAPLVTTAGTAMAEVAHDSALLVPPADVDGLAAALAESLAGGEAVGARRRRGIEAAARHTWERSAEGHLEAYRWARDHRAPAGGPPGDR